MSSDNLIVVGRLGRPRGVRGDMYITPLTDYPQRFAGIEDIHVRNRDRWEKLSVASTRFISGRPVIRFEGVTSPEQASRLTNRELAVPRSQLVELPENRYFLFDLVGCEVVEYESGEPVGKVIKVEQYPANDVYVVETTTGGELLVPAVKQFVRNVDVVGKQITVATAGLIDADAT